MKLVTVVLLFCLVHLSEMARILAIFPHMGKSHFFMFKPFVEELALRGHYVTVLTFFPSSERPGNLQYISLEGGSEEIMFNALSLEDLEWAGFSKVLASLYGLHWMGKESCEGGLNLPAVQDLIHSWKHFDLVLMEFFNTDCYAAFAHRFQAPLVGMFSSVMMPWHNQRFGNPDNPAFIPNHFLNLPSRMSFFERVGNTLTTEWMKLVYRVFFDPTADAAVRKAFGEGVPPVRDIVKNASLFLINSHFSLFQPRPMVPGIIEMGGFHVEPPKGTLPREITDILDNSPGGVVFFSLGSTVKGSTMPPHRLKAVTAALGRLKLNVLWKWEGETMPDKPDNVYIRKWFPQNELLAHPKVKAFITHAGLMGSEEAVYHGVPMVVMPLFGDQPVNAASLVEKGVAVHVDYFSLTEETLYGALTTVLEDGRYAQNAKLLSQIFKDRPLSNMDTATYWIEYVLRYKGARHMRSASVDLPWYSVCLLDVYAFLLLAAIVLLKLLVVFVTWYRNRKQARSTKSKAKTN